ncbi:hypothetical protein N825_26955 [Skermanella stibiiresistens SB22]|uniref:Uncharacterized protein n=1 Tax=Skermanella stibiiresistens SB22 TaxID=1385369 RepID=W9GY31_9PROT|nr:hypothetical protein N825_26955 [Skermanella stibiiresistens SB22]
MDVTWAHQAVTDGAWIKGRTMYEIMMDCPGSLPVSSIPVDEIRVDTKNPIAFRLADTHVSAAEGGA